MGLQGLTQLEDTGAAQAQGWGWGLAEGGGWGGWEVGRAGPGHAEGSRFYSFFFFLRAAPTAFGISQARGRIRATAASLPTATAMPDPSCVCDLHHRSWQHQIFNLLSKARDQTCEHVFSWVIVGFINH